MSRVLQEMMTEGRRVVKRRCDGCGMSKDACFLKQLIYQGKRNILNREKSKIIGRYKINIREEYFNHMSLSKI